ncbi:MAG: radical SAM protein [Magnetococcales bacterium]|nr:radical SAM protein [Magnetococcales bacterium]
MARTIRDLIVLIRIIIQVLRVKITRRARPVSVNLQVTKHCNLACSYCFADLESLATVKDPDTSEMMETIDELYRHGCRHIILMGGEPLIRKDIGTIIRHIKNRWMRCEIVTNGYYVAQHLEDLQACDSVCVSLDGLRESNDVVRGKGCHDTVVKAMDFLHAKGIKTRIHAIITRENLHSGSMRYIAELAARYGFAFNFSMAMLRPELRDDSIHFTEEEIQEIIAEYRQLRMDGFPVFTSERCLKYVAKWPKKGSYTIFEADSLTPEEKRWVMPCNYGRYNAFLDVDGSVYKCCLTWKNGLKWREHGMQACIDHVGRNLLHCVSCRSIGDIDRAMLLEFASLGNLRMVWNYLFKRSGRQKAKAVRTSS